MDPPQLNIWRKVWSSKGELQDIQSRALVLKTKKNVITWSEQGADSIADQFERVSNQYSPLLDSDVSLLSIPEGFAPKIEVVDVYKALLRIKTSTLANDIPAKVIKMFALELVPPLRHLCSKSVPPSHL